MNAVDLFPILLLAVFVFAFVSGVLMVWLIRRWRRKSPLSTPPAEDDYLQYFEDFIPAQNTFMYRPAAWLAVRGRDLQIVQSALGLVNPQPCTWIKGLAGEQKLFIAPPVNGWILVVGSGLPDPADDVDAAFRFLLELSRKLGEVQLFNADPILGHHGWARVEAGRVVRAYAWAGRTLWNQGMKSRAELELGVKCYHYLETPERTPFGRTDVIAGNVEKVPQLAARWSLDPATIDERIFDRACGIAGEPARFR